MGIEGYTEVTAMGLVGIAFIVVLKWMLKQQSRQMLEMTLAIHTNSLLLLQLQKDIIRHDTTIRGINPSAGETEGERINIAYSMYKRIVEEINRTATVIEKRMETIREENKEENK